MSESAEEGEARRAAAAAQIRAETGIDEAMVRHRPLPIGAAHFANWLALFEATARDTCPPAAADCFIERARRMGRSIEAGLGSR